MEVKLRDKYHNESTVIASQDVMFEIMRMAVNSVAYCREHHINMERIAHAEAIEVIGKALQDAGYYDEYKVEYIGVGGRKHENDYRD